MVTVLSVGTELERGAEHVSKGLRMSEFCYNHDNGEICDWRFWVVFFGVSLVLIGLTICCRKKKKDNRVGWPKISNMRNSYGTWQIHIL